MTKTTQNKECHTWTFDFALSTFYEIDTCLLRSLLPSRLHPVEVVPGISLFNVTAFNFPAGGLGFLPQFQELTFSAIVAPDLSRGMPKFAMYVLSLGSSCGEHLAHSSDFYKLPVYPRLLSAAVNPEEPAVDYSDDCGTILTMRNCSGKPDYREEERYFQAFTSKEDKIYIADIYIKAWLYEHQQPGEAGAIHRHPFFFDLEPAEDKPSAYLQMIGKPGQPGRQLYYSPEIFP